MDYSNYQYAQAEAMLIFGIDRCLSLPEPYLISAEVT